MICKGAAAQDRRAGQGQRGCAFSGVRIGAVTDLELDPKSYLATVHMNIHDDVRVPTDSALEVSSGAGS